MRHACARPRALTPRRARPRTPARVSTGDERKLALVAEYEQLKGKGMLDQALAKRRRRQASKDRRLMPRARRGDDGDDDTSDM